MLPTALRYHKKTTVQSKIWEELCSILLQIGAIRLRVCGIAQSARNTGSGSICLWGRLATGGRLNSAQSAPIPSARRIPELPLGQRDGMPQKVLVAAIEFASRL